MKTNIEATSLGLLKVSQITELRRCICRPYRSRCSVIRKPERETRKTCHDSLTQHQSKRDAAIVSPSPLLGFFRWRLASAGARCALHSTNVGPQFCPKALHHIHRIRLQSRWDPVNVHFKLPHVLESGRLCMRLRLGIIDQVLEGGGSVMVRGCSRAAPSS